MPPRIRTWGQKTEISELTVDSTSCDWICENVKDVVLYALTTKCWTWRSGLVVIRRDKARWYWSKSENGFADEKNPDDKPCGMAGFKFEDGELGRLVAVKIHIDQFTHILSISQWCLCYHDGLPLCPWSCWKRRCNYCERFDDNPRSTDFKLLPCAHAFVNLQCSVTVFGILKRVQNSPVM